jgi:hypothetical protein
MAGKPGRALMGPEPRDASSFSMSGMDGLSVEMNELWATHDGGDSWEAIALKPPPILGGDKLTAEYRLPLFSNDKRGALLADFSLPPADPDTDRRGTDVVLYTTADAGKTWKFASVVAHFSFPNSGVVAAVAGSTLITAQRTGNSLTIQHIPLDAPGSVSATNSGLGFAGSIAALAFATAEEGWILTNSATCVSAPVSDCAPQQLFATVDGGATWNNIMPGLHLPPTPPPSTSKPIPLVWKCCVNPCKDAQTKTTCRLPNRQASTITPSKRGYCAPICRSAGIAVRCLMAERSSRSQRTKAGEGRRPRPIAVLCIRNEY